MPSGNIRFILFQIRCIKPFFNLYFRPVLFLTFMYLKKIAETIFLIISSKREKPTDSRTKWMNPTSSFLCQKTTAIFRSCHLQIRQNDSVYHIQFNLSCKQSLKSRSCSPANPDNIQRIQHNRASHPRTTGVASLTIATVCFYQIIAGI